MYIFVRQVLEAAPLRQVGLDFKGRPVGQVSVTCSDCSTASAVFLAISCDAAVLPELNHTDGPGAASARGFN